ncbi:MAG: c-type cytochrome, partial [Candidatus Limnocylindria bacterium]
LPTLRVTVLCLALVAGLAAGSQALVQAVNATPPAAAQAQNPVPAEQASVDRGERVYRANCASCHGPDGDGDGPTSAAMPPAPRHLAEVVPQQTDGELAYRIANGLSGTAMPGFAATLSETDRWDLVNYLRHRWDDR